jgi:hypothetical protein
VQAKRKSSEAKTEKIDLLRGKRLVSTITGAFGQSLRETRLTAMLGYLIALQPHDFIECFGFRGRPQQVSIETRHDLGRSDILVVTTLGTGVVEAKIDATDPIEQSRRYPANWVALVTNRTSQNKADGKTSYVSWHDLALVLEKLSNSRNAYTRLLSRDLLKYLQEHRMTRGRKATEIYAREINEPITLRLFLQAHLYACKYEASSSLSEALYFAPHFGESIAKRHGGINSGISYIAQIEAVGTATTWKETQELLKSQRGQAWIKRNRDILQLLRQKWFVRKKSELRSFVFLSKPQLVFNPPVPKSRLQRGTGWLSKRSFTFDQLFSARR